MRLARGGQGPVDNTQPRGRGRGSRCSTLSNKPHTLPFPAWVGSTHHARQLSDHMSKMSVTPIFDKFLILALFLFFTPSPVVES